MKTILRLQIMFCLLFFCGGSLWAAGAEKQQLRIFASILPQKYLIEQIAGDLAVVEVLVGPGMSPHTFEPLPQQMSRLSRASVFFMIGVPFEQQLVERLSSICPDLKLVDTSLGIPRRTMSAAEADHQHDGDCVHSAGSLDPHIWLDPTNAKLMAKTIASGLLELMPAEAASLSAGLNRLLTELTELDLYLSSALQPLQGQTLLVFHPAFGYFAARYGLLQQAVEVEGKEPGPRQLAELIRKSRELKVQIVFVQKQFPVTAAEAVARSINGAVVAIDPLAEDYSANLRHIAAAILAGQP